MFLLALPATYLICSISTIRIRISLMNRMSLSISWSVGTGIAWIEPPSVTLWGVGSIPYYDYYYYTEHIFCYYQQKINYYVVFQVAEFSIPFISFIFSFIVLSPPVLHRRWMGIARISIRLYSSLFVRIFPRFHLRDSRVLGMRARRAGVDFYWSCYLLASWMFIFMLSCLVVASGGIYLTNLLGVSSCCTPDSEVKLGESDVTPGLVPAAAWACKHANRTSWAW